MSERVVCIILGAVCVLDGLLLLMKSTHGVMFAMFGDSLYYLAGVSFLVMACIFFYLAIYCYR